VDDSQKDTTLVQHLLSEEAPTALVVFTTIYRALTIAVAHQHISQWYPSIVSNVRSEVQQNLHGFIRWLNSNSEGVRINHDIAVIVKVAIVS
jgi:hypothetical protein